MVARTMFGFAAACLLGILAACETLPADGPAVLVDGKPQTLETVKAALSELTGKTKILLGAGDPTMQSEIAVLPPRLTEFETASPAIPKLFDLKFENGSCVITDRATGGAADLPSGTCVEPKS